MAEQDTIEIQDCIVSAEESSIYRALYNGKVRNIRIWPNALSNSSIQRLLVVHNIEEDFPKAYDLIRFQNSHGLLLQSISGLPIVSLQSSLSPKMVYALLAQVCHALHQSHMTLSSLDGILLSPQGNVFIYTPSIETRRSKIDGIWKLGWWALERLSPTKTHQAEVLMVNNQESEYNALLKQTLKRIESGLPNQQWIASALQSFEQICAFHPSHRWTAETTSRMMSAYAEQAIGLNVPQFCAQHPRLFENISFARGPLTGQVHPTQPWNIAGTETADTNSPTQILKQIVQLIQYKPSFRNRFLIGAGLAFCTLHSLAAGAMWLGGSSAQEPSTSEQKEQMIQVDIEHNGIRKLVLESGLAQGPQISLTRSNRSSSSQLPVGRYKLSVKDRKTQSTFVDLDSDTRIVCELHDNIVECNMNNRILNLK